MSAVLFLFSSQQIASANVVETELFCKLFALGSFSRATTAQNQEGLRLRFVYYFRVNADLVQMFLDVVCDGVYRSVSVNSKDFVEFWVMVNDWLGMLIENVQSFFYDFFVVIWATASLSSMQKSFDQFVLVAVKIQNSL